MKDRKKLLLIAISLGFAVVQLDVSVVNVAITSIGGSLGGGIAALQWVVTAYTLVFASLILTAGALGDRLGAKRLYVAGFTFFTAASLLCGFAPNVPVLIAGRALQGIGAAILVPCSLTLLNHAYREASARKKAVGLWAAGASIALAGGPLVGGLLIGAFNWRAIFFINLPLGVVGIVLTLLYADETSEDRQRKADPPGQLSAITCLACLAGAIIDGGKHGFLTPLAVAGYLAALVALGLFIARERAAKFPMLPLRLFRVRAYSVMSAVGLFINIAFYGFIFILSLFLQDSQHLSALQTGLAFAPMTIVVFGANVSAAKISATLGENRTIVLGALLVAGGCLALASVSQRSAYGSMLLQLVAIGAGLGLIVPVITASQLASVDTSMSGVASGTLNTARQTGSVVGVSLYGSLAANHRGPVGGLHEALLFSAVIMGLVVAVISQHKVRA